MIDIFDMSVEAQDVASVLFLLSQSLIQGNNLASDEALGEALHGIASHIQRISEDLSKIKA